MGRLVAEPSNTGFLGRVVNSRDGGRDEFGISLEI